MDDEERCPIPECDHPATHAGYHEDEEGFRWGGKDRAVGPCIFHGCVSRDRHWHGGFPGGYDNPADPEGPPIEFTTEPAPGVRDYNGALLREDAIAKERAIERALEGMP